LNELMDLREDGSFRLNQEYFDYLGGLTMTSERFNKLFGGPPRKPESKLTQREMDLARSVQDACETIMLRMVNTAHRQTGLSNLCLAGGVALNCVGNGRILREGPFKRIWIQPAAGDAGGAVGVAYLAWHRYLGQERRRGPARTVRGDRAVPGADFTEQRRDAMSGAYLGPSFGPGEIEKFLVTHGAPAQRLDRDVLINRVAELLADGNVIGWFVDRMEFGPRALGARSILGDPRNPEMQKTMNLKIKFRESFRPFAPSVLRESVGDYFEIDTESPYMLLVANVREERRIPTENGGVELWGIERLNQPRSDIPAVTHVDYSARIQTVSAEDNPEYHDLLAAFKRRTGCGVLVNTSFNVRGEPIVCTPLDAYRCFMRTNIDYLVLWPYLLAKTEQPEWREEGVDWREIIPLD
ncbi:MAG TPA: carbamoyltransferase C-terminal domain-containing protein, partial [Gemmatimonadales bacterium]|nr:carbamoyltransferase C-terminal domain-containing protein [Gemmatimonadales bacterium]